MNENKKKTLGMNKNKSTNKKTKKEWKINKLTNLEWTKKYKKKETKQINELKIYELT